VIQKRESGNCLQWVHLRHGDAMLMLKSPEPAISVRQDNAKAGVTIYFYVSDIK
jgi:hypothetical protein